MGIYDDDIEYVLIVFVIWGDKVKLFMREVVVKVLYKDICDVCMIVS